MNTETEVRIWTCEGHRIEYGEVGDRISVQWECPRCVAEFEQEKRQLHGMHGRYQWWRESSGVPSRYRAAIPSHIQPLSTGAKTLAAAVGAYVANMERRMDAGEGMLLLGPPGLGKTLSLCVMVNAACKVARGPVYAQWPDTLADLKASFNGPKDDRRRQAVENLRNVPLLALDELGVKGMSDFDHSELFALIDYRYRERLPTLVAANATPGNFASLVGERVADRLREVGPVIALTGDSARGKSDISGSPAIEAPADRIVCRVHSMGEWRERKVEIEASR